MGESTGEGESKSALRTWCSICMRHVDVPAVIAAREKKYKMKRVISTMRLISLVQTAVTEAQYNGTFCRLLITEHGDLVERSALAVCGVYTLVRAWSALVGVDHEGSLWGIFICEDLASSQKILTGNKSTASEGVGQGAGLMGKHGSGVTCT